MVRQSFFIFLYDSLIPIPSSIRRINKISALNVGEKRIWSITIRLKGTTFKSPFTLSSALNQTLRDGAYKQTVVGVQFIITASQQCLLTFWFTVYYYFFIYYHSCRITEQEEHPCCQHDRFHTQKTDRKKTDKNQNWNTFIDCWTNTCLTNTLVKTFINLMLNKPKRYWLLVLRLNNSRCEKYCFPNWKFQRNKSTILFSVLISNHIK